MNPLLAGLRGLGPARLLALALVGVGMLAMLAMLALHGGNSGRMALLYGDLDLHEASEMTDALDRAHIDHAEDAGGDRILVGAADVARARLLLAKGGLPSGGSIGYEIFDRSDPRHGRGDRAQHPAVAGGAWGAGAFGAAQA